jgi:hypothetical protein
MANPTNNSLLEREYKIIKDLVDVPGEKLDEVYILRADT